MGTNIQSFRLNPKLKTQEQVRKWYADAVQQSQYEDGHSYSGEIGCTSRIYFTGKILDVNEDLEALIDTVQKGDVAVFQIKVINENMATLVKWREKLQAAYTPVLQNDWNWLVGRPDEPGRKLTSEDRKRRALYTRTKARYEELRRNAAARSKKLQYAIIAACPS